MPPFWLKANITPVFKSGDRSDPLNYRPIALTCIMCKLMEHVIKDQLLSYLLNKNLISRHQHAFIIKHSTATNLLECTHDWSIALNDRRSVDIIYIDFRRAFDSIVHSKLLYKLQCYGINGKLLNWISVFLSGRTQCVVLENCHSSYSTVLSGVPQGSVLGPILFILFINDIEHTSQSHTILKLFADDLKLYSVISLNNQQASHSLQQCLDTICEWAKQWQFSINTRKTKTLTLSNPGLISPRNYLVDSVILSHTEEMSDLGVLIDCRLNYNSHINNIVSKALQRCGVFFRGFVSRELSLLRKAFITYIRPILEYNSSVWNPSHKQFIDLIENVQRRFTKRIPAISALDYLERLAIINLEPLELRRQ